MDKGSYDDVKEQGGPSPLAFDVFIPWACVQLQIEATIVITKVVQREYISKVQSQTDRSKLRRTKPQPTGSRTEPTDSVSGDLSPSGFQSRCDEITVRMFTTYDSSDKLVQIKFDKNHFIPQKIIKVFSLIIKFHPNLNTITINSGLDVYVMHELCKLVCMSNITNIILDNTSYHGATYDTLLEKQSNLKYLSLARCKITDDIVKKIASKLVYPSPASQMLCILNLASNRITDVGAKYLAEALRSNRCINYLNLADNAIDDEGADSILKTLLEFPITHEEQLSVRFKHMEYLKTKKDMISKMIKEAKASELDKKTKKKILKQPVNTPRKSKAMEKELSLKNLLSMVNTDSVWHDKARTMAENAMGPFNHPFSNKNTVFKDGIMYCTGNNMLCYLNLAYNNLSYYTVKKILQVLTAQKMNGRKPRGVVNVCIEGNILPKSCVELLKIDELIQTGLMADRRPSLTKKKSGRD